MDMTQLFAPVKTLRAASVQTREYRCGKHTNVTGPVKWSDDGRFLAFSVDSCILDMQTGAMLQHPDQAFANWQPRSHNYAVLNYVRGRGIEILDAETDCSVAKSETADLSFSKIDVLYSQDGHFLSLAYERGGLQVFDAKTLKLVIDMPTPRWSNLHATWRPKAHTLLASYVHADASKNYYERTLLVDADRGQITHQDDVPDGRAFSYEAVWSPDGSAFVNNASDGRSAVYSATGALLLHFPGSQYLSFTWSPSGNTLVGSNSSRMIAIHPTTGESLCDIGVPGKVVDWLDADTLLLSCGPLHVQLWTLNVRTPTLRRVSPIVNLPYPMPMSWTQLSPDKRYISLKSEASYAQELVRIDNGSTLPNASSRHMVHFVAWAPDSRTVAYAIMGGGIVMSMPEHAATP